MERRTTRRRNNREPDMTYRIDLDNLTVIRTDRNGEDFDLNAEGAPCESIAELREFVAELCEQGAFDGDTRDELLAECPPSRGSIIRQAAVYCRESCIDAMGDARDAWAPSDILEGDQEYVEGLVGELSQSEMAAFWAIYSDESATGE